MGRLRILLLAAMAACASGRSGDDDADGRSVTLAVDGGLARYAASTTVEGDATIDCALEAQPPGGAWTKFHASTAMGRTLRHAGVPVDGMARGTKLRVVAEFSDAAGQPTDRETSAVEEIS